MTYVSADRARKITTDVLMENLPDGWDGPTVITDAMVEEAVDRIVAGRPPALHPDRQRVDMRRSVRKWMADQAQWDGYVDPVAVDRAVALDYRAWVGCTELERRTVIGVLSSMVDPWGTGADMFSPDYRTRRFGHDGEPRRAEAMSLWPPVELRKLVWNVSERRRRRSRVAA